MSGVVCHHTGDSSDVTLAFEDAQFIPPFSREETDDKDVTDTTDDTDDTADTDYTDDTDDTDYTGWYMLVYAGMCWNRLE